jgi:hypothetical protein
MLSVLRRIHRTWSLVRLYWGTEDCDWSTIAILLRYQIRRTRQHIEEHNMIVDAPVVARQMRVAESLISRMLDEPYYDMADARFPDRGRNWARMIGDLSLQDQRLLGLVIGKHLTKWWD